MRIQNFLFCIRATKTTDRNDQKNPQNDEKKSLFSQNTNSYTYSLVTVCKIILHKVGLTVVAMLDIIVRI